MTKKIFRSIYTVAIVVLLTVLTLIIGILYGYYNNIQIEQLKIQTEFVSKAVENEGLQYLMSFSNSTYRITWIDKLGNVLYDNKANSDTMENHLQREEVMQAMKNGAGNTQRYSSTLTERQFYSARRLSDGSIIRLSVNQLTWWILLLSMSQPLTIIFVIAFIVSIAFAKRLSKRIIEPLNKIDLDNPENTKTYEELNPLLKRISSQQIEINIQKKELQRKKDEFTTATENMSEGIVLLNSNGTILSINNTATKILELSSYCIGKDFILFGSSEKIHELLHRAYTGIHSEAVIPINNSDYQFNASPIFSDDNVTGVALIIFDITEKEKTEQMRREFTANVSHELRTPLQTIAGSAELLSNGMVADDDEKKFSFNIYNEARRLITLVEDIIKLSNLDESSSLESFESVDLYEISKTAVGALLQTARDADVALNVRGEKAIINGDAKLLYSICYNLCENSIKYNRKGGSVDVLVECNESIVRLAVSDTGIGISPEQQTRVFERFYRVDKSHSKEVGGTGLGLSIVKHASKVHNAGIEIQSELNKGTTITVSFPKEQ